MRTPSPLTVPCNKSMRSVVRVVIRAGRDHREGGIVVTIRPLSDIFSALEGAEPAHSAEDIDEYRELAMLARAWERGSLKSGVVDGAPGGIDDAKERKPAPP